MNRQSAPTLVAAALLAAGATAELQDSFAPLRDAHRDVVRAEREQRVRDAYAAAPAARRDQAVRLLALDPAHGTATRRYDLDSLASVERVLAGEGGSMAPGPDPNEDFLALLDVRPVPGVFAAREEGRGEAVTVHVELLADVHVPEKIVIGLDWIAPDGRRRRARTEGFPRAMFDEGLEMYVRPPESEPSDWRLAPLLLVGDRELRAPGVRVSCRGGGAELRERIAAEAEGSRAAPLRTLRDDLDRLRDHGARSTCDASVAERLAHFGLPGGSDWPHPYGWHSIGADDRLGGWGIAPSGETHGAVVLVSGGRRDDTAAFSGALAVRWHAFAEERGRLVLSVGCSGAQEDAERLAALLRALADGADAKPVVVLTGNAAVVAPPVLRDLGADAFDRVLLHGTPTVARGVRVPLDVPALGIAHAQEEDAELRLAPTDDDEGVERWWFRRRAPDFLVALEVPELLARWMDEAL